MTTFGWILILWAAYLLFKHRKNLKGAKKLIIGIVTLFCFGGIILAAGSSGNNTTPPKQAASKVTKHHQSKKDKEASSSSKKEDEDDEADDEEVDDSSVASSSSEESESDTSVTSDSDSDSNTNSNATAPTNNGDMMTDQQGTIVGNSKSMIYHTPDQAGYRMNSANAVYFNSEAEAQAAGYRKALR